MIREAHRRRLQPWTYVLNECWVRREGKHSTSTCERSARPWAEMREPDRRAHTAHTVLCVRHTHYLHNALIRRVLQIPSYGPLRGSLVQVNIQPLLNVPANSTTTGGGGLAEAEGSTQQQQRECAGWRVHAPCDSALSRKDKNAGNS